MKHLFRLLLCIALLPYFRASLSAADSAKAVELKFDGKAHLGEPYIIALNMIQTRTYSMKPAGLSIAPKRKETKQILAEGELIYDSIDPFVARFTIQTLTEITDGKKTDFDAIAGSIATIRESGVNLKNIPLGSDSSTSVLGDAPTEDGIHKATAAEIRALVPKAKIVLNGLFSAPTDSVEQYFGKSHTAKQGEPWKVSAKPMLDAINGYGLKLTEKDVTATAEFVGAKKIGDLETNKVYFLAESGNVPGYDFKLEITFSFPKNGKDAPLRMERKATELVDLTLPEGLPGFSGSNFSCINENQTDLVLIRKSTIQEKKKSLFNFF